jgi:drug/metabolite transporter (DMT)-like permease
MEEDSILKDYEKRNQQYNSINESEEASIALLPLSKSELKNEGNDLRTRPFGVALLVLVIYMTADLLLPLYNKALFNGFGSQNGFHFPVTTALIQVGFVAFCLLLYNLISQCFYPKPDWIFYDLSLLKRKMRALLLVSFLFAAIITLTGLGLDKSALNTYVLLRTSSIVWVVILSLSFRTDKFSVIALMCAYLIASGSVLLGLDESLGWSLGYKNLPGALIIILSAFCSGCATVALRKVILETEKEPGMFMSILDMTMLKMGMAAVFMIPAAFIMETLIPAVNGDYDNIVWQAYIDQWPMALFTILGVFVTLVYQSAIVAFTTHSQAISVGLVHQLIMFPQLILYSVLELTGTIPAKWHLKVFKLTVPHILGASLIVVGALIYALFKLVKQIKCFKQMVTRAEKTKSWKKHLFDIL